MVHLVIFSQKNRQKKFYKLNENHKKFLQNVIINKIKTMFKWLINAPLQKAVIYFFALILIILLILTILL